MLGVAHLFCQGVPDPDLEIVACEKVSKEGGQKF